MKGPEVRKQRDARAARAVSLVLVVIGSLIAIAAPFHAQVGSVAGSDGPNKPVAMNIPTVTPGGPTVTPTPTSQPPQFITNDSGAPAIFLYLTGGSALDNATGPPDCGTPVYEQQGQVSNQNWAFVEVLWPAACVDPESGPGIGDKVAVGYRTGLKRLFSKTFLPGFPTETFVNDSGSKAGGLTVVPSAGSIGQPFVVQQPAVCGTPAFVFEPLLGEGEVEIIWPAACVGVGDEVVLHLPGSFAGDTPHSWQPASGGVLAGDVDCSGGVNAIDAALLLQFLAALLPQLPCSKNADANLDGNVNAVDAALILQLTAGLIANLPP